MLTHTHTFVELELSQSAYEEIKRKLLAADYGHCIDSGGTIDMHGLAVVRENKMLPHQERVVAEKEELDQKLTKLNTFIDGPTYAGLGEAECIRLARQAVIMKDYSDILSERIAAF